MLSLATAAPGGLDLVLTSFPVFSWLCWVLVVGLADRGLRCDVLVSGPGWAPRAWPGGFRCIGRQGGFRSEGTKSPPDPRRSQPPGLDRRAFPRMAQVRGEGARQPQLGTHGDGQRAPPGTRLRAP